MLYFSSYYVTHGFVLVVLLLLIKYCRNTLQSYGGYPILHLIPYVLYCVVFRKFSNDMELSSHAFMKVIEKCVKHMKEGICMTYIFGPVLLVYGEEPTKVLSREKSAATKPDSYYHIFQDGLGAGLVTNNGEKWKKHRKMLDPAFGLGMLKAKVPLFNEHAQAFVKDLEILVGKPSVDLIGVIKCHYFNALSESIFGLKQTEESKAEKLKYFHAVDNLAVATIVYRVLHPWLQWKFMLRFFSCGRQILREYEEVFRFSKNAILKMKQHITLNQTSDPECFSKSLTKSFMYILLQHHLNDPSFTFEDLHGEVNTFMVSGYDTVSYATMWCLYTLGLYPEIQEKAFNEVDTASTNNNYISYEDCSKFTYLESVILETLRLYPPVPIYGRQLTQDVQCGERKIAKDTIIAFIPYAMHRNPDIYPDPENFDPERFLGDEKRNSWTYMPFSEGYRNCIGKRYALMEMKIFLAYFLRNFEITSLDRREDIGLCWNVVLQPAKPLRMLLERR